MASLTFTDEFNVITCSECGVRWAMPAFYQTKRRDDHKNFYCPNGHEQYYPAESEAERLKRQLQRAEQQIARAEDETRLALNREAAAKRELKKVHTRIGAGVCPCCNRTFSQLARHMQSKHPDVPFVPAAKIAHKRS